uniref:3FTx-Pse-110 n=1 Tax=Pseudonaja modesta TaxID=340912 RepID=R4FK75_9SAUR
MKTLLLTLVVVTIMCLDLGYTRTCLTTPGFLSKPCPSGQEVCYTKAWCNEWCPDRGKQVEMGCAAICPSVKPKEDITCCSEDNCNPRP